MSETSCRVDIWLWRARFAKSRSLAAAMVERGAVRLTHNGVQTRLDKPSRTVHVGDQLVFALSGRLVELEVLGIGERRGPSEEARALYSTVEPEPPTGG
ncbi:RNA-binding S4 domain-containing protein [Roseibacterium beibuensis]|uniref:RNA-binding S4 domain-containing protein n=1 Tax=[Roseibacterium] beibuensis TaxID=1193142 RepID=UPI00217CF2AF|nr:RNA-binding S4 domain-containing protein [Roseibacterium beibuensis]MCS6622913.1 RNA-binding S4 domain-containing protein [Roseibacterium beibuensis]